MHTFLQHPPTTPQDPVVDVLHGVELSDPFRWLENPRSEQTARWIADQTAYACAYFDSLPERELVRQRVHELLDVAAITDVWHVGECYFYLKRAVHDEQPSIVMRATLGDPEELLVYPPTDGHGNFASLQILNVSCNGKLLAFGVKASGADTQSVGFFDVTSKTILSDHLQEGFGPGLVFTEEPAGFYYTHEILAHTDYHRAVWWHRLGTDPSADVEIFFAGRGPNVHVGVFGSSDGRLLAYLRSLSGEQSRTEFYIHAIGNRSNPTKMLEVHDFMFMPFFVGSTLCAMTNLGAPNGRFVKINVDQPDPANWIEVISELTLSIRDFAVAGQYICVNYVEAIQSTIRIFDLNGHCRVDDCCPAGGTATLFSHPAPSDRLFYAFSSFLAPPAVFALDPETGDQQVWFQQDIGLDGSLFDVERATFPSEDGTQIPICLVASRERRAVGAMPAFITGYGGFGASVTPKFNAYSTFLLEQGFLFAVVNVRGGGELGMAWHEAGKRRNRQTAFTDFIRAAEWLIDTGRAIPDKLAVGGGSNGGLLVAAAMTQRPSLYRAVICLGPLLDMLRYHMFDSALSFASEYGTSDDPGDFQQLYEYSPYHQVNKGVPYPAVLLISGDADNRCNPMHVRKMIAALQSSTSSDRPILAQYTKSWGHAPSQPLGARIGALTNRLAFVCHELGIDIKRSGIGRPA
jgi:prolyl oligopeptidase